jgi:hypothetical protein
VRPSEPLSLPARSTSQTAPPDFGHPFAAAPCTERATAAQDLLAEARAAGMNELELDTFSALKAAARLYREAGFRVTCERETDIWGPSIVLQRYSLQIR